MVVVQKIVFVCVNLEYRPSGSLLDLHGVRYPGEMADGVIAHRVRVAILALG